MTARIRERGEGKIGCVVSLVIMAAAIAAGIKIIPVYYSNNEFKDASLRKAEAAAGRNAEDMVKELKEEARRLGIGEALAANAITIVKKPAETGGKIIITLRYSRKIDLYGVTQFEMVTDEKIDRPLLENVR